MKKKESWVKNQHLNKGFNLKYRSTQARFQFRLAFLIFSCGKFSISLLLTFTYFAVWFTSAWPRYFYTLGSVQLQCKARCVAFEPLKSWACIFSSDILFYYRKRCRVFFPKTSWAWWITFHRCLSEIFYGPAISW